MQTKIHRYIDFLRLLGKAPWSSGSTHKRELQNKKLNETTGTQKNEASMCIFFLDRRESGNLNACYRYAHWPSKKHLHKCAPQATKNKEKTEIGQGYWVSSRRNLACCVVCCPRPWSRGRHTSVTTSQFQADGSQPWKDPCIGGLNLCNVGSPIRYAT